MVVASTGLSQESSVALGKVHPRGTGTACPAPGSSSVMRPAATAAPDDVVAAVVPAADAVESLDVDGVRYADGRL